MRFYGRKAVERGRYATEEARRAVCRPATALPDPHRCAKGGSTPPCEAGVRTYRSNPGEPCRGAWPERGGTAQKESLRNETSRGRMGRRERSFRGDRVEARPPSYFP